MEHRDLSDYLMWMVPNDELVNKGVEEKIFYQEYKIGVRDHRDFCKIMLEKYQEILDHSRGGENHVDLARTFTKFGFIVAFYSGAKINGKYICQLFLPEQISEFQKEILLSQKEVFLEKFHQDSDTFSTLIYSSKELEYRSGIESFRSLKIEELISHNGECKNGVNLLYNYLNTLEIENMRK